MIKEKEEILLKFFEKKENFLEKDVILKIYLVAEECPPELIKKIFEELEKIQNKEELEKTISNLLNLLSLSKIISSYINAENFLIKKRKN